MDDGSDQSWSSPFFIHLDDKDSHNGATTITTRSRRAVRSIERYGAVLVR